jgi:dihydrofolate synthase/folylpolyglutamate synthase
MAVTSSKRSYEAALEFLFGRINYEQTSPVPYSSRTFKLSRMRCLLAELGSPHEDLPAVHIAGTKGKGSTAAMIAQVLTRAGHRTGFYSSPHLQNIEERLAVDGVAATQEQLIDLVAQVAPVVAKRDRLSEPSERATAQADDFATPEGRLTYFEIVTAMALLHFRRCQVDAAVLEVGMGGRLDSTNVCYPAVSVITSISLDHVQQLGGTIALIAREKAGIIKPGIPVVSGIRSGPAAEVIAQVAQQRKSPLIQLGRDFDYTYRPPRALQHEESRGRLDVWVGSQTGPGRHDDLELALLGPHQAANAAVAVATLEQLRDRGWTMPPEAIREGLARVTCPARCEVVSRRPIVVIDAAHNVASAEALVETLGKSFQARRRVLIFATTEDKDAQGMLRVLQGGFDEIILTRYTTNPRGLALSELARLVDAPAVRVVETPAQAWDIASRLASPEDLICVTGSFYIAGELRQRIAASSDSATAELAAPRV